MRLQFPVFNPLSFVKEAAIPAKHFLGGEIIFAFVNY